MSFQQPFRTARLPFALAALVVTTAAVPHLSAAQDDDEKKKKPDYPPFKEVAEGYEKVVSTADGDASLYTIWTREKDGQMLAELKGFQGKKYFFAMTVAGGETFAGLQAGDMYVYWRQYDKRMALMAPQLSTVSKGDQVSKDSVGRLFTDRVILDVPIVCMGPGGGPVIDLDELLLGNAGTFFGYSASGLRSRLARIHTAKAFPQNVEIAWEVPAAGGVLKTFHWSISEIRGSAGFEPREADTRVGYFTTAYRDLGKYDTDTSVVRYINRWHLEPAVPNLELSPPKKPIVFYIEHTTPHRYRRFVRDGLLSWNKAFEQIGIVNAIEVYYQDKETGAHMDKDPEDVRYNFIRWLNNDVGTAIGPSRIDPTTGEILDADIVLTDGWIRAFQRQYDKLLPDLAMEGMGPESLAWLEEHPRWDPRLMFAKHHERRRELQERARARLQGDAEPFAGHAAGRLESPELLGDEEFDGLVGRHSQVNGMCLASRGKAIDVAVLRMSLGYLAARTGLDDDEKKDEKLIDGMPAAFIGPMLADLVAHEVGHTLGLRHNFIASSLYDLATINSDEVKGKKPFTASVMDYNPININMEDGGTQGDFAMIDIGPYDMWAIQFGYTPKKDELEKILSRCTERALRYATDEDTWGPDPLARRYDFAADPLDYANSQRKLIDYHRPRLLEEFVEKGESWAKAREGYNLTLSLQVGALNMMSNWIGGSSVRRLKKGDGGDGAEAPDPTAPISAAQQRKALEWVIDNSFQDAAFGLTPELMRHLTVDKWMDAYGNGYADPTFALHDTIMSIQSSVLTMLLNTGALGNVFDNEQRVDEGEDALTVAELMRRVKDAAWTELGKAPAGKATAREPMISSLRRNLQREHVGRIIELSMDGDGFSAAAKVVASIARMEMRELRSKIADYLQKNRASLDDYTAAHLEDCHAQLDKALSVQFTKDTGSSGGGFFFF
jgi:hypothetical protein